MNLGLLCCLRMEWKFIYMNKCWVVDRYEEEMAVLENVESLEITVVSGLDVPEGTVLVKKGERFVPDFEETAARSRRIKEKYDRLKKKKL